MTAGKLEEVRITRGRLFKRVRITKGRLFKGVRITKGRLFEKSLAKALIWGKKKDF